MSDTHISLDRLAELNAVACPTDWEAQHLQVCPACTQARARIGHLLDDVTTSMAAEADAHFPADRLARQRSRILDQLQQLGRPARVIAFPGSLPVPEVSGPTRPASRWIAAAAVAGLLVGVVAGRAEHDFTLRSAERGVGTPQGQLASRGAEPILGVQREPAIQEATMGTDDDLLGQIENAAERGLAALDGLDELTPLPWELR